MKMAKDEKWASNNKKWENMPDVMLSYRAASFFSRAYCPDLTGGFHSSDELSDSQDNYRNEVSSASSVETMQVQEEHTVETEEHSGTSLEALQEEILA